ncbi:MAG TPA: hypothetical protein VFV38_20480 [Ktedonobacteraceae bacterium]|nr:hypothetical protein [Ktedonobacteraceae bacterium]
MFAESLLSSAYEHLRFTALGKHSLVEVWVVRKQLAYFTDGGKPVYVGEEEATV